MKNLFDDESNRRVTIRAQFGLQELKSPDFHTPLVIDKLTKELKRDEKPHLTPMILT